MYTSRLSQLGVEVLSRINTSRLKECILSHAGDLEAYNKGRDVYLAFRSDVCDVIGKAHFNENPDNDAMHLAKAAALIRKDIFSNKYSFNGSFESNCQLGSIPLSLLSFVNILLYGPNVDIQTDSNSLGQAALTIHISVAAMES